MRAGKRLCSTRGGPSGAKWVNKGEGVDGAAGRDEDAIGGGCSREGESCDRFGGGVNAVFLLSFSSLCSLGRAPRSC